MGIFDRLRSSAPSRSGDGKPDTTGQDATRLIDEGHALEAQGKLDEAMQCYREAIRLAPNPARGHLNRGNVLLLQGNLDGALDAFRTALDHQPDYAGAYYNLGNALLGVKQFDEAIQNYRHALEINPDYAEVHCSLGVALKECGDLDSAATCFHRALQIEPSLVESHLNLGSLLLSQGRYAEGWIEYEARYDPGYSGRQSIPPNLPYQQWQGQSLSGKSIVVWPEQGFGDEIQFARYIPLLKAQGATRITLICKPALKSLLESLQGIDTIITQPSLLASMPIHDYWTFSLSLPLHFATTIETIPAKLPYLGVSSASLKRWQQRLPEKGLKVGLVWKGSALHSNDVNRSLPDLSILAPLWSVPGVSFISLQKGQGEEQATTPPTGQPIFHLGSDITDFADTAAIVAQLDLVICIDTAIAHLAGALNKACWVLLPASGTDWRWLRERSDSPWYPGVVRLFRQKNDGDWAAPVDDVANNLAFLVKEGARGI
jgi:tetratricopeptide (TPR) repeat protein